MLPTWPGVDRNGSPDWAPPPVRHPPPPTRQFAWLLSGVTGDPQERGPADIPQDCTPGAAGQEPDCRRVDAKVREAPPIVPREADFGVLRAPRQHNRLAKGAVRCLLRYPCLWEGREHRAADAITAHDGHPRAGPADLAATLQRHRCARSTPAEPLAQGRRVAERDVRRLNFPKQQPSSHYE